LKKRIGHEVKRADLERSQGLRMYQDGIKVNFHNVNLSRQRVKYFANVLVVDGLVFKMDQVDDSRHHLILNFDYLQVL
jgi:hypothetical protein